MKTILIFLASLVLFAEAQAQNRIDGYYNPRSKEFVPGINISSGRTVYKIGSFHNGYAVITIAEQSTGSGIIDTTGKVCVPMRYDKVDLLTHSAPFYVLFRSGDSLGVSDISGTEHFRFYAPEIPIHYYTTGGDNEEAQYSKLARQNMITPTKVPYLVLVKYNQKMGLYSLTEHKYIIQPQFDYTPHYDWACTICNSGSGDIEVDERTAWGKQNGLYRAVNLTTCEKSEPYLEFAALSTGLYYIRLATGQRIISADAVRPVNTVAYTIEEYFNDNFIVSINGKFGLMNAKGEMLIPATYNDIYFASKDIVWVKQDGYWAMLNNENKLLTAFDFFDIDKSNELFWENYIYLTRLDTSTKKLYSDSYVEFSDHSNEVKRFARKIKTVLGTRKLYSCFGLYSGVVRKSDGYHEVSYLVNKVDPTAWEMIYLIPGEVDGTGELTGYKKNGKYGVEVKDVNYDGIVYDTKKLSYYSSRLCIVKNGYIYTDHYIRNSNGGSRRVWERACSYTSYVVE